jgi:hypothetical protein
VFAPNFMPLPNSTLNLPSSGKPCATPI